MSTVDVLTGRGQSIEIENRPTLECENGEPQSIRNRTDLSVEHRRFFFFDFFLRSFLVPETLLGLLEKTASIVGFGTIGKNPPRYRVSVCVSLIYFHTEFRLDDDGNIVFLV